MKQITLIITLFVITNITFGQDLVHKRRDDGMLGIMQNLEFIENSYISMLDFNERREAIELMDRTIGMIERLSDQYPQIPEAPIFRILDAKKFASFLVKFQKAWPQTDKERYLMKVALKYNFTIEQTGEIIKCFTFDSDKVEIIKLIYPIIIGENKDIELLKLIGSSSRDKLFQELSDETLFEDI